MEDRPIVNIGVQRFDKLMEERKFYIDKTEFIREWWEYGSDVTLITRPRRFGKTLNMSMIECFFSVKYAKRSDLFEELSIWKEKSSISDCKFRELQGIYPVIFLSFANIKAARYQEMKYKITEIIAELYEQNDYLLEGNLLSENEKSYYSSIKPGIGDEVVSGSVRMMANFMQRYYDRDVIILLDEYDTPMQEAWLHGYWDDAAGFFGGFFNSTFKTNPYLCRGLITGVTRVAKDSIFTGLNNLDVITTTSDRYAESFGFTEEEVFHALEDAGLGEEKLRVKEWYDGFTFGSHGDIYNPWSIASFISNNGRFETYWANTSSNELVNSLIQEGNPEVKQTMEELLQGKNIVADIDEQIVFNQLDDDADAIFSLLLATGYLKALMTAAETCGDGISGEDGGGYTLSLTNLEVKKMFRKMIKGWFKGTTKTYYNEFIRALLNDDVRKMNTFMNKVALGTFSSFDSGNKPSKQAEPERFYHGFVLGMVVNLSDTYKIRSNRESGFGRYDVMLEPVDKKGKAFIFEFKVQDPDEDEANLEDTLANAHAQIEKKQYEAELTAEGFLPEQIRKYGFAFKGKICLIG
ncbi:MAG: ATP-binding protein [Roseburia sp.]|nr:ATP-binding protein [Roseburia sp.]